MVHIQILNLSLPYNNSIDGTNANIEHDHMMNGIHSHQFSSMTL
jgi:hypothetical protein